MVTIYGANSVSGYDVANSLRLNSGDSAQMNKTLGTATNVDKYTISMWVKRSRLAHRQMMMRVINPSSTSTYAFLEFQSDDSIGTNDYDGSGSIAKVTHAKFRDPSAWYHIVLALDSTQGTASNRSKLYVNGTQITSFGTDSGGSQNQNLMGNTSGKNIYIGGDGGQDTRYCGLYMAEVCFIDGQQLTPTSFGEFDEDSPTIWKPIDVSGLTFGNNGFYLDFEDSGNLGNDVNGGTDLTEVNIAATDQTTDTCTNNFATLNPLDNYYFGGTLSEGNVKVVSVAGVESYITNTIPVSTGKWYWEIKTSASGGTHASDEWNYIGVSNLSASATDNILATSGTNSNKVYEYAIHGYDGDFYNNGDQGTYAASFTTGDILGIFLDLDNNRIYWSKNGQWADGSGNSDEADPNGYKSVTDPASTPGGFYFPAWGDGGTNVNKTWQLNFGGTPGFSVSSGNADPNGYGNFEYPTEGGYALCTKNLAEFG